MDLRRFYLDNVKKDEYYYRFYDLVKNINTTYNVFHGTQNTYEHEFVVDGIDDAIEKFKYLCLPENENHSRDDSCLFYLILFYFKKCGYTLEEFPRLTESPPKESYDFVNKEIRNRLINEKKDNDGTVTYKARRELIRNLTFSQKGNRIELADGLEAGFRAISNRQASFMNMSPDEKLEEIANLIEYMLKRNGKFLTLNYQDVCLDFINDDIVKIYRNTLQCFRHASPESITERQSISNEQKSFLIDYGVIILNAIHILTTNP